MTALMRPLARHRQVDFRPTWSPYSLCLGWRRCRTMRATMASGLGQHARKKPSGGQAERRTGATLLWLMETWNRATPIRVFFLRSVLSWAPFLLWLTCPRPGRVTSAWPLCHTTGELVTRHRARGKHCHTSRITPSPLSHTIGDTISMGPRLHHMIMVLVRKKKQRTCYSLVQLPGTDDDK